MEAEASRILKRNVQIDEFYVDLPNAFELRGVRAWPERSGSPWLEISRLRGELRFTSLLQRELRLTLLQVDGLTFRVQDYGGGDIDLPGFGRARETDPDAVTPASVVLLADHVRFEDATFAYDNHTLPWTLTASHLSVGFDRTSDTHYRGNLQYQAGELQIADHTPVEVSMGARIDMVGRDLTFSRLTAKGPFYQIQARGNARLGTEPQADLSVYAEFRPGSAARSLLGASFVESQGESLSWFEGTLSLGRGRHLLQLSLIHI